MHKKRIRIAVCTLACFMILILLVTSGINTFVWASTKDRILTEEQAAQLEDVDCILVLGCGVREDGSPSHMLEDRLKIGIALYENGSAPKLLMSGDHGQEDYDEVNTMKNYALECGIPTEDIFMDHAGFSTYESVYRAKEIFGAEKIIIVTQKYHLFRALHIAEQLGLEACGVSADLRNYSQKLHREFREVLARVKDFGMSILQPEPTYMGEVIPIMGDGTVTDDKEK